MISSGDSDRLKESTEGLIEIQGQRIVLAFPIDA